MGATWAADATPDTGVTAPAAAVADAEGTDAVTGEGVGGSTGGKEVVTGRL